MSEIIPMYTIVLHTIKTDIATHESSLKGGFQNLETANNIARTLVRRQSDHSLEGWDEYSEEIDDGGRITIHGAIDTMRIVCFVWNHGEFQAESRD